MRFKIIQERPIGSLVAIDLMVAWGNGSYTYETAEIPAGRKDTVHTAKSLLRLVRSDRRKGEEAAQSRRERAAEYAALDRQERS